LVFLCFVACIVRAPQKWEYDSVVVYLGTREVLHWMLEGRGRALLDIGPFAPFQYLTGLPSVLLGYLGIPVDTYRTWAWINIASFFGMAWILFRAGKRAAGEGVAWAMVIVVVCGPLLVYALSTFNESASALVTLAFAALVTGRGGALACAALCYFAGITKEVAPPLLVGVWLTGLWMRRRELDRQQITWHLILMVLAALLAVASNAALNLLRYGSLLNTHYLSDELHVPKWSWRLEWCLALWLAPNGGVLFFWPTYFALLLGTLAIATRRAFRREGADISTHVALALLAIVTVGLSDWYTPFGWWSWGPRLLLPWLPAALLLVLRGSPDAVRHIVRWLLVPRPMFVAAAVLLPVLALPHVLELYDSWIGIGQFFDQPEPTDFNTPSDIRELAYVQGRYEAWRKWTPMMWRPMVRLREPNAAASAAIYGLGLVLLLWQARARMLDELAAVPTTGCR
jgi:hypothetical protein